MLAKIRKVLSSPLLPWGLLILAVCLFWYYSRASTDNDYQQKVDSDIPPIVSSKTSLDTAPKTSKDDNDVELTQTYKAKVNGQVLEAPIVTKSAPAGTSSSSSSSSASYGTKGVITQEIDLSNIVGLASQAAEEKAKDKYKKNWEMGIGLGVVDKDMYGVFSIQRNYKEDRAIQMDLMTSTSEIKGVSVQYKRMF